MSKIVRSNSEDEVIEGEIIDDHHPMTSPIPQPPRSGLFGITLIGGCLIFLVTTIIVPLLLIGGIILTGLNTLGGIFDGVSGIFSNEAKTASVTTTQTVVNSVRPLGQLVSISAQLAKADISVDIRNGFQNSCGYSANHVAQGTIEAGVDLNGLTPENVRYNSASETYIITLPQPQLTSCRMDFIRQYDRSTTICGADWDEVRVIAQYEGIAEFRDDAIEGGILERARTEAEITLTNFLALATNRTVEIQFVENDAITFPSSCRPDAPEGWTYNEENNSWSE